MTLPEPRDLAHLLTGLLGRPVTVTEAGAVAAHPATFAPLVDNDNQLIALMGADLALAHRAGAALAMVPVGAAEDAGTTSPDEDLCEYYVEVANVLSRAVNEALPQRVRLDPGLVVEADLLSSLAATAPAAAYTIEIGGYGAGQLALWMAPVLSLATTSPTTNAPKELS